MNRIAELEETITTAKAQRAQGRKLRLQHVVTSCNHQIRNLGDELVELTK